MEAPKCRSCGGRHWDRICPTLTKELRGGGESRPAPITRALGRKAETKAQRDKAVGPQAGVAPGPRKHKQGRPRLGTEASTLSATKPWIAEGMSERTWYRRQKEAKT